MEGLVQMKKCKSIILKDKKIYHVIYANETKSKQFKSNKEAKRFKKSVDKAC